MKLNLILSSGILFFCSFFLNAQNFTIQGTVLDAEKGIPLEAATVYAETIKDSTLLTYTISDAKGKFKLISTTKRKEIKVLISSIGYQQYEKRIALTDNLTDLGNIKLDFMVESLDEVVVKSRAPVTVKKDTLEFNVASFKTKKDANVEDLLKELPGVEVDEDGKIKVNGKEVNKILVNGKPFFGDDPTIATRNLTKDIVDKIQVTDTKTDSEAFTGEKGDTDNKTINITIQEDKNKGVFGRVAAGGGTDERYEAAGIVNIFDNDQRISVLAGSNNINSPGFSFGEIRKMFGGGRSIYVNNNGAFTIDGRSFGGGEGITTSRNLGANYTDDLSKVISVTADYFYAGSDSKNDRIRERENILADSRFFSNSMSSSKNETDNHNANLNFDVKIDSTLLINIKPTFTLLKSENRYENVDGSTDENGLNINRSDLLSNTKTLGSNFKNVFNVTKRFGNRGAFVRFNVTNEFNTTKTERFLESNTEIFGDNEELIQRNQFTDGERSFTSLFTRLTYRYPIVSKKLFLDFKYSYRLDNRENLENTFDFNEISENFTDFNALLSTDFQFNNIRRTPGARLSYEGDKLSAGLGGGSVYRTLENKDKLRDVDFKKDFNAIEIDADVNYKFSAKASMYLGYGLSNRPPDVSQLQPFQDVSDPLNIITGNPNLKPSNAHTMYFGFNDYDFQKRSGFYSYFNLNVTNDKVIPKTIIDDNLVRNTTYDNVNGDYRIYGSMSKSKSFKIDSLRTLKTGFGLYGNVNRSINFNNGVEYSSDNISITPNINFTFTWKNILELKPNYRISFTNTSYDVDSFEDRNFVRHAIGIRTATFVPKNLEWRNDVNFSYNPDVAPGFQRNAWFWNSTLAYSMLKKKAILTLKVYDLLNQNTNARRSATANYIEDSQSTVLEQYFMLSFSYKFNSLGKKGETGGDSFFFD